MLQGFSYNTVNNVSSGKLKTLGNQSTRQATNVLIVDDEESQRTPLAAMISAWGFNVETAADGQEALDKLGTFSANVIVTDLMMPRMDGFELMKRLAADGNMPPAIVLTAFGNIETAIQTIHDLGAFWFLEKPIQPAALRVLLERASAQSQLAEETERLQRQLSYQGVLVDMVGTSSPMQQVFSGHPAGCAQQSGRTGGGRKRYRKRIGRPRHPSTQQPARRSLRRHQLRGHA